MKIPCPVCIKKKFVLSKTFHPVVVVFMSHVYQFCTIGHAVEYLRHWGDMKYP